MKLKNGYKLGALCHKIVFIEAFFERSPIALFLVIGHMLPLVTGIIINQIKAEDEEGGAAI